MELRFYANHQRAVEARELWLKTLGPESKKISYGWSNGVICVGERRTVFRPIPTCPEQCILYAGLDIEDVKFIDCEPLPEVRAWLEARIRTQQ